MFRAGSVANLRLVVKKASTGVALGGGSGAGTSNKLVSDEKFALGALEYLYEWNPPNDAQNKRARDVLNERRAAEAYDRLAHLADTEFSARVDRLTQRMNEALDACPDELLEEATLLNSEMPPNRFRLPKQTPPLPGFEAAFGFDVPQLRVAQLENSPTVRPTDRLHHQAAVGIADAGDDISEDEFPFVDSSDVRTVLRDVDEKLNELHGTMRSTVPLTGASGEEWEVHCALQHRALSRQKLILELAENPELYERFHSDGEDGGAAFAQSELERRGILPLEEEQAPSEFNVIIDDSTTSKKNDDARGERRVMPQPLPEMHYAQSPKYHPFRQ